MLLRPKEIPRLISTNSNFGGAELKSHIHTEKLLSIRDEEKWSLSSGRLGEAKSENSQQTIILPLITVYSRTVGDYSYEFERRG